MNDRINYTFIGLVTLSLQCDPLDCHMTNGAMRKQVILFFWQLLSTNDWSYRRKKRKHDETLLKLPANFKSNPMSTPWQGQAVRLLVDPDQVRDPCCRRSLCKIDNLECIGVRDLLKCIAQWARLFITLGKIANYGRKIGLVTTRMKLGLKAKSFF